MGSYMQEKSVTYRVDKKTGKEEKLSEKTGPKKKFEQVEISADEFNDKEKYVAKSKAASDKFNETEKDVAKSKAAFLAAKGKSYMKKISTTGSEEFPYKKKLGGPTKGRGEDI